MLSAELHRGNTSMLTAELHRGNTSMLTAELHRGNTSMLTAELHRGNIMKRLVCTILVLSYKRTLLLVCVLEELTSGTEQKLILQICIFFRIIICNRKKN